MLNIPSMICDLHLRPIPSVFIFFLPSNSEKAFRRQDLVATAPVRLGNLDVSSNL